MAKFKPKYSYNEIAKFIEIAYAVMKYEINPKFIPFDLILLNKHKIANVKVEGVSSMINGWNQNGLIYVDPNFFLEYDKEYFEEEGKHFPKMQMKGIIINCIAHEISHTGQRIHYVDNFLDKTEKLIKRMEAANELHSSDWIIKNCNYLGKYLGMFSYSPEFSGYSSYFNEVSLNDYEYLNSWNEKLFDEMDYLFMLNTSGFLKETLKKGFKEFKFSLSSNGFTRFGLFNIRSILESEEIAVDILKFINDNINIYKSFISEISLDEKILNFHMIEKERIPFSKVCNSNIFYSFDYPPEINFIENFSYKDRLIEFWEG